MTKLTHSPVKLFRQAKARGERVAMISLYDAPTAALACDAGADILLVGDSMGNVVLGHENPIPVTMEDMLLHTRAVSRGVKASSSPRVPIVADLTFGAYATVDLAVRNAVDLMRSGAAAVKLEGSGKSAVAATETLVEAGIPVVGHLGYTPQSSMNFETVVQGKTTDAAIRLLEGAKRMQAAGCCATVLEVMPREVAARVTAELEMSTIGIGAGPDCDAQVLVWHDLVGFSPGRPLRFAKRYAEAHEVLSEATEGFVREVKSGAFPQDENAWEMDVEELKGWQS